jgi:hypothetical protein
MVRHISEQRRPADAGSPRGACPPWCVAPHGTQLGEEDWVHTSEPLALTDRVLARVCMTLDPTSEVLDGPWVLIGSAEFTPYEANEVGLALQALATFSHSTTRREAL